MVLTRQQRSLDLNSLILRCPKQFLYSRPVIKRKPENSPMNIAFNRSTGNKLEDWTKRLLPKQTHYGEKGVCV